MKTVVPIDLFSNETWYGGFYEAAVILGKCSDNFADQRLRSAIVATWSIGSQTLASNRSTNDCNTETIERILNLRGSMSHDTCGLIAITTVVVRETDCDDGEDWLYIGIPLGGLSSTCPAVGGWPFGDRENSASWREPIENALAGIAIELAKSVSFQAAAIGYEIAGIVDNDIRNGKIPSDRLIGYVIPRRNSYQYFPTTRWD